MTELLVSAGVASREKFTTVYSGIEIEPLLQSHSLREIARRKLGYQPEHVVIGKIARLFHLKGHGYLIEAATDLVRAKPLVRFLLVGDGILRNEIEQRIRVAGLESYFQFVGLAQPEEIPGLVAAMDIVVHTSLREGLARALVHGLLAGKPVVSFDIDGAREVVFDDVTGYLVAPQNSKALAAAIHRLLTNPSLRARLGDQGRALCEKLFCHRRTTGDIRALYDDLLSIAKRRSDC
jgi:glycosyltransferase involved in cell wall biosynthesis